MLNWFKKKVPKTIEEVKDKEIIIKNVTYKTELQIVKTNSQVVCIDYEFKDTFYNMTDEQIKNYKFNPVEQFINQSFQQAVMHTFDKSNKHHTSIATVDIRTVLYKPLIITIVTEIRKEKV